MGTVPVVSTTTETPDGDTSATNASTISTQDAEVWREVSAWKGRALTDSTPVLSPLRNGVAEVRGMVTAGLRKVPGVARVDDGVQEALHQLASAGAGAGAATLRRDAVRTTAAGVTTSPASRTSAASRSPTCRPSCRASTWATSRSPGSRAV